MNLCDMIEEEKLKKLAEQSVEYRQRQERESRRRGKKDRKVVPPI